jgi:hypothetical protein
MNLNTKNKEAGTGISLPECLLLLISISLAVKTV